MAEQLSLYLYPADESLADALLARLKSYYHLQFAESPNKLGQQLLQCSTNVDGLVIKKNAASLALFEQLRQADILLPALILLDTAELDGASPKFFYHESEICLATNELNQVRFALEQAIANFVHSWPVDASSKSASSRSLGNKVFSLKENLVAEPIQRQRLVQKLRERLGYLGIYYKRDTADFWCNLTSEKQAKLLAELSSSYREIVLNYFQEAFELNQAIDRFVDQIFLADISVSQIIEMHMELMDEFSQQLKLEGRTDEILLDYRLVLIDLIAHLCEMYRRSVP